MPHRSATPLLLATLLLTAGFAAACGDDDDEPAPADHTDIGHDAAQDTGDDAPPDAPPDTPADDPTDDADVADDAAPDVPEPAPTCDPALAVGGEATSHDVNGWSVSVAPDGAWRVTPPGGAAPVLSAPGACVEVGGEAVASLRVGVGEPFVNSGFGAFLIELESPRAQTTWTPVSGAPPRVEAAGGAVALTFARVGGGEVTLRFEAGQGPDLKIGLVAPGADGAELVMDAATDEAFFGLGTQVTGMELRGRTYPLWTQEQGIGKVDNPNLFPINNTPEAAYAPMGVWHSSAGYTAIVDHDAFSELDLGRTRADRVALRSWAAAPAFVLVAGDTPKARLSALTERYTGRVTEPPPWMFAPWNDSVGGPERLHEIARILRDNDIPSSAIWSEDWIGGEQTATGYRLSYAWEWDMSQYPTLPQDVADLHAEGFAFLAYFNTFVPDTTRMYSEGVAGDWLVHTPTGAVLNFPDPAFRNAGLADLTDAESLAWLASYLRTAADDLQIDGWMADFAEWLPQNAVMDNGEPGWIEHNRYPVRWQQLNREVMESVHAEAQGGEAANNWVFFARSGWASTRTATAGAAISMWGGDQNTDWGYDDGLPTIAPMATHAGLAGVAIFGTDIAGYTSITVPNTTKELFYRWSAAGAFHPLMRTHHGSDECSNWSFDRDAETLAHYRRYAVLHTLLYPLFRQLLAEALTDGLPLMRHPWLVEPDRPGLWRGPGYAWFLGDDLLVAPVWHQGATTREVALPEPAWWPLLGDAPLADATPDPALAVARVTVDAPVTELPVFVRPGTVLPLLDAPVDSFYGAAAASDATDLDDAVGRYALALYPASDGSLRPITLDGATIEAAGWTGAPDWAAATDDGAPLSPCESERPSSSCALPDGVILVGANPALALGDATLTITSPEPRSWRVQRGGAAFGAWAAPTALTELNPDIPPPCEE